MPQTFDAEITADTISFKAGNHITLVLDKEGMIYKGKRIEDAGEAHRAFMEMMKAIKEYPFT